MNLVALLTKLTFEKRVSIRDGQVAGEQFAHLLVFNGIHDNFLHHCWVRIWLLFRG